METAGIVVTGYVATASHHDAGQDGDVDITVTRG